MIYVLLGVVSPECLWRGLCGADDTGSGRPRWHPTKFLLSVFHHPFTNFFIFFHFSAGSVFKSVIPRRSYSKVRKRKSKRIKSSPTCTKKAGDRWQQNPHHSGTLNMADSWIWTNQERARSPAARIPRGGRGQSELYRRTLDVAMFLIRLIHLFAWVYSLAGALTANVSRL